jgi:hypothetical protein
VRYVSCPVSPAGSVFGTSGVGVLVGGGPVDGVPLAVGEDGWVANAGGCAVASLKGPGDGAAIMYVAIAVVSSAGARIA